MHSSKTANRGTELCGSRLRESRAESLGQPQLKRASLVVEANDIGIGGTASVDEELEQFHICLFKFGQLSLGNALLLGRFKNKLLPEIVMPWSVSL